MRQVVFASSNPGKLKEVQALLGEGWEVKSAQDFPHIPEVIEDLDTFEGNAAKKARTFARETGLWALADDSGLVVDALDGRPGVYSARYAPTEAERIAKMLAELKDVPPARRTARFVCVLALVLMLGTLSGALIMGVISSGCDQLGVVNATQDIMIGVIIIAAVSIDQFRHRRQE